MKLTAALPFFGSLKSSAKKSTAKAPRVEKAQQTSAPSLPRALPLIGRLGFVRQAQILLGMMVGLVILTAVLVYAHQKHSAITSSHEIIVEKLEVDLLRIMDDARSAARGEAGASGRLQEARTRFKSQLDILAGGGEFQGLNLPPIREELQGLVKEMSGQWALIDKNIGLMLAQRGGLLRLPTHEAAIRSSVSALDQLAQRLAVATQDSKEAYSTITYARQLHADVRNFNFIDALAQLSTETPNPQVALSLAGNTRKYESTLKELLGENKGSGFAQPIRNPQTLEAARALEDAFSRFAGSVRYIVDNMAALAAAKQASRDIHQSIGNLIPAIGTAKAYDSSLAATDPRLIGAIVSAVLMLITLAFLGKLYIGDARRRAILSEQENRRNQDAILNLLDEMSRVAEGDLTVQAKVTEDVTGAIADSINYTIEQLRQLVVGVTKASNQVTHATGDTQKVATQLLKASQKQTAEIQSTSRSVVQIAETMQKVSDSASQSAQVAQSSLTVAEKGSVAVQNAIRSMNDIREQIQETAKRIKRLGESSQEIGEIVQLITDITEQTNVLALNAAIQAASAGEAGRGFAVVAEEVQRLAERSAEATKHISSIVHSIQQDTQSTVEAMERSTQGVVEGTRVADEAGQALHEIEDVSKKLAELIGSISTSTGEQAKTAEQVAANMKNILSITQLTSSGTQQTARSTNELIAMAVELKHSVSGFKLA